MITNLFVFAVAALFEIAGCFAFWMWLRQGRSWLVAAVGVLSLIGFALTLTRVETGFAGRAYAAYGGVYIAASLVWLWGVEGATDGSGPARRRPGGCRGRCHRRRRHAPRRRSGSIAASPTSGT